MNRIGISCVVCLSLATLGYSVEYPKRTHYAQRISVEPPRIDGKLDDGCWSGAGWTSDFRQQQPHEGQPGSQKTEFKILYDNNYLYIGARAYDNEPDKIEIRASRRDDFAGDIIGFCFDSYYDHRTGHEFNLTAGGTKIDLVQMDTGADWFFDMSWDAVWDGKTAIEDSAWTAEMRIPFSQLRFAHKDEQIWGLHVWRWIHRYQEESQFQVIPLDSQGRVHRFGILRGIRDIPDPRRIELLPYMRGSLNRFAPDKENPYAKSGRKWGQGFGVDGRIGLAGNFNVDFTVNPDFGQVEADPSVVNLTAFETFYEEKRPFFIEGNQLLDFKFDDQSLFYSRRIGRAPAYSPDLKEGEYADIPENTTILGAGKISGKTSSGWSIGLLSSLTSKEVSTIQSKKSTYNQTVEPLTTYTVGRMQRDFAEGNHSLGAMMTVVQRQINDIQLNFLPTTAITGGIDGTFQWGNRTFFINTKAVFSHIRGDHNAIMQLQQSSVHYFQRPDADHVKLDSLRTFLSGSGGEFEIGKGGNGHWRLKEHVSWRSPGLELNDLGYLQQADLVEQGTDIAYVVNEPGGILNNYEVDVEQHYLWDFNGDHLLSEFGFYPNFRFKNFWSIHGYAEVGRDRMDTRLLRGGPAMRLPDVNRFHVHLFSDSRKRVQIGIGYYRSLYNDRISGDWNLTTDFYVRAFDNLDFSLTPAFSVNRDNWQYVTTVADDKISRYILGRINQKTLDVTIRFNYYLSPDLSIQYYGQLFISAGHYTHLKRVTDSKAGSANDRYVSLSDNLLIINPENGKVDIDETGDGLSDYQIDNPNFNKHEFHSNLVLRWEYKPGSTFYLVWSHGRSQYIATGEFDFSHDLDELFQIYPNNVFLIKFNHWFSL